MKKLIINMWKCFTNYKDWQTARALDKASLLLWNNNKNIKLSGEILVESEKIWNKILS